MPEVINLVIHDSQVPFFNSGSANLTETNSVLERCWQNIFNFANARYLLHACTADALTDIFVYHLDYVITDMKQPRTGFARVHHVRFKLAIVNSPV